MICESKLLKCKRVSNEKNKVDSNQKFKISVQTTLTLPFSFKMFKMCNEINLFLFSVCVGTNTTQIHINQNTNKKVYVYIYTNLELGNFWSEIIIIWKQFNGKLFDECHFTNVT